LKSKDVSLEEIQDGSNKAIDEENVTAAENIANMAEAKESHVEDVERSLQETPFSTLSN
jgi:hypothetical protein